MKTIQIKGLSIEYQTQFIFNQRNILIFFYIFEKHIISGAMRLEIYGANNLNFVEFNITGDIEAFQRCDKDSLYMDTEMFNLFSECFEKSNNLYDYFGPTKYSTRNLVVLLNALKANIEKIEQISSFEDFVDFAGSKFLGSGFVIEIEKMDKNWRLNWEQYKAKLVNMNQQIIEIINRCIDDDRILWLIGY
jgi:hypothetical protein